MAAEYKAVIKPLTFTKTQSDWVTIPDLFSSHPLLDYIIKERLVFHTSSDESDFDQLIAGYSCGVLMHVPVDEPAMCVQNM